MWLLVVSRSSDYWLCISPHVTLTAIVNDEVCLGIPLCVTRWVPRGSRGLILGALEGGRHILGSTGRGRPFLYPVSVFLTAFVPTCAVDLCTTHGQNNTRECYTEGFVPVASLNGVVESLSSFIIYLIGRTGKM